MKIFTYEEINLINSLNKPIDKIDMDLVNLIIDKMIQYKNYEGLINLLNNLYDFAQIPKDISNRLIIDNNKECISAFLEKEDVLYP